MVGGRPVGEGDVCARQQDPGEIEMSAPISDDDCSGLRVVSVWFGLPNMNGIQPDSLERWSVQVERNMSKAVLVTRNT